MNNNNKWNLAVYLYLFLTLASVSIFSLLIPQDSWDVLGHLGSSLAIGEKDPVKVHQLTYQIAEQTLDAHAYEELVNGSAVRTAWARDARSFNQLLPFYQPRVILTHVVHAAYTLGFNPIQAMRVLSTIAATLGMFFLLLTFRYKMHGNAVFLVPFIILLGGILEVARFEGPDALSFCFFCITIYFLGKKHILSLVFLALLPLTRSDMIVMVLLMVPYYLVVYKSSRAAVLISGLAALGFYLACNGAYGNYGWMKQFYVAKIQYLAYPADVETIVTPSVYLQGFTDGVIKLIYNKMFLFFLLGFGVVSGYLVGNFKKNGFSALSSNVVTWAGFISCLFVIAHFIIFPSMDVRYFAGQYTLVAMCSLCILQYAVFDQVKSQDV